MTVLLGSFHQKLNKENRGVGLNGILFTFQCRNGKKYVFWSAVVPRWLIGLLHPHLTLPHASQVHESNRN